MILDKKVNVRINNINIKYYNQFYKNLKLNKIISVPINKLTKGSKVEINVKCDDCGIEKKMKYSEYYRFSKGLVTYLCKICVKSVTRNTMLKKYGCEYPLQNKDIMLKFKKTNIKRYGYEYPLQNKEIQKKQKDTNKKRYGVEFVSLNSNIRDKQTLTKIKNLVKKYYNFKFINYKNKMIELECEKGHKFEISRFNLYNRYIYNTLLCTKCNPIGNNISGLELQLNNFVRNNYDNIILENNNKKISPLELDIYLPDINLAFEFNGVYWHNELYKDKNYHLNKTELCEKQGFQLIHIWEDDWIYKQNIVKSMILNKLGKTSNKIYGRKTEVKEITDNKLVREFLETNHLQGFVGSKVKLGLFFENELVSLMTFGKRRVAMGKKSTNDDEYELLRFCNKLNTNVLGGASKLFKFFKNNYNPKEITTYADRSHSTGGLYEKLGFDFIGKTVPNYYYVVNKIKNHRFNFRKDQLVKNGFDSSKTEHEIMLERNIYRIYDSGSLKYDIKITN